MAPIESNGANILYHRFIKPFVLKHEKEIDDSLGKVTDIASSTLNEGEDDGTLFEREGATKNGDCDTNSSSDYNAGLPEVDQESLDESLISNSREDSHELGSLSYSSDYVKDRLGDGATNDIKEEPPPTKGETPDESVSNVGSLDFEYLSGRTPEVQECNFMAVEAVDVTHPQCAPKSQEGAEGLVSDAYRDNTYVDDGYTSSDEGDQTHSDMSLALTLEEQDIQGSLLTLGGLPETMFHHESMISCSADVREESAHPPVGDSSLNSRKDLIREGDKHEFENGRVDNDFEASKMERETDCHSIQEERNEKESKKGKETKERVDSTERKVRELGLSHDETGEGIDQGNDREKKDWEHIVTDRSRAEGRTVEFVCENEEKGKWSLEDVGIEEAVRDLEHGDNVDDGEEVDDSRDIPEGRNVDEGGGISEGASIDVREEDDIRDVGDGCHVHECEDDSQDITESGNVDKGGNDKEDRSADDLKDEDAAREVDDDCDINKDEVSIWDVFSRNVDEGEIAQEARCLAFVGEGEAAGDVTGSGNEVEEVNDSQCEAESGNVKAGRGLDDVGNADTGRGVLEGCDVDEDGYGNKDGVETENMKKGGNVKEASWADDVRDVDKNKGEDDSYDIDDSENVHSSGNVEGVSSHDFGDEAGKGDDGSVDEGEKVVDCQDVPESGNVDRGDDAKETTSPDDVRSSGGRCVNNSLDPDEGGGKQNSKDANESENVSDYLVQVATHPHDVGVVEADKCVDEGKEMDDSANVSESQNVDDECLDVKESTNPDYSENDVCDVGDSQAVDEDVDDIEDDSECGSVSKGGNVTVGKSCDDDVMDVDATRRRDDSQDADDDKDVGEGGMNFNKSGIGDDGGGIACESRFSSVGDDSVYVENIRDVEGEAVNDREDIHDGKIVDNCGDVNNATGVIVSCDVDDVRDVDGEDRASGGDVFHTEMEDFMSKEKGTDHDEIMVVQCFTGEGDLDTKEGDAGRNFLGEDEIQSPVNQQDVLSVAKGDTEISKENKSGGENGDCGENSPILSKLDTVNIEPTGDSNAEISEQIAEKMEGNSKGSSHKMVQCQKVTTVTDAVLTIHLEERLEGQVMKSLTTSEEVVTTEIMVQAEDSNGCN